MVSENEEVLNWKEDFGRKYQDLPVNEGDAGDMGFIPGSGRCPGGGMETHSSILAGKIPWTEKPDRLQPMGFSRQEYWSGFPFLLQGIFPTQG